jgi:tripartite-type tricarboxylate transporter receptor subunit TctC
MFEKLYKRLFWSQYRTIIKGGLEMKSSLQKRILVALMAVLLTIPAILSGMVSLSEAAPYPERDITFIVPFKPGGGLDSQARILAPFIKKYLPKQVNIVVENHSAAGGKVGALKVFDAKPDGYTIGILSPNSVGLLYVKGDLEKRNPADLVYLCRTGHAPYMLVLSARSRFKNIREMKGEQVKFGGTTSVVFQGALIARELGAKMVFVTYDGFPETAMAVMRGDVDVFFFNWDSGIKHVNASEGKLQLVFIASENRLPELPNLATTKEFGIPLERDVMGVMAAGNIVLAPPGLPAEVRNTLEKAIQMAINDPELENRMQQANYTMKPTLTPKETKDVALGVYKTYIKYKDLIEAVK